MFHVLRNKCNDYDKERTRMLRNVEEISFPHQRVSVNTYYLLVFYKKYWI